MIIVALNAPKPRSYSEIGFILRDIGVLSNEDANLMRALAGLRNILVYSYVTVDREEIVEFSCKLCSDAIRIAYEILSSIKELVDPVTHDLLDIVERVKSIFAGRVLLAYLFGSRIRGRVLRGDYDIAVYMHGDCGFYNLDMLVVDVANVLGVNEENVDIVCLNNSPPEIIYEALGEIPIIIEDHELAFTLKYKALLELLDLEEAIRSIHRV